MAPTQTVSSAVDLIWTCRACDEVIRDDDSNQLDVAD
jgi:hypothetical protein